MNKKSYVKKTNRPGLRGMWEGYCAPIRKLVYFWNWGNAIRFATTGEIPAWRKHPTGLIREDGYD